MCRSTGNFFQRQAAVGQPLRVDRHKRVLARQHDGVPLALALGMRIDVPRQQRPRLIAQVARLFQRQCRVGAKRNPLALARPRVAKVPRLGAVGRDVKEEAIEIGQCIGFIGSLGLPDRDI